jgi:hypothetical protein
MKVKALAVGLFVAGVSASFAIAGPPPGKGKPNKADDSTASPALVSTTLQTTTSGTTPQTTTSSTTLQTTTSSTTLQTTTSSTTPQTTTQQTTTTATTTQQTTTAAAPKVTLCHPTGSKTHPFVKITISKNAVKAHTRLGDVAPSANGDCPASGAQIR